MEKLEKQQIIDFSEELEILRETDEITSVNHATETMKLWANLQDTNNPNLNGESNIEIVEGMLSDEDNIRSAIYAGFHGRNSYPIVLGMEVRDEIANIFGHSITGGHAGSRKSGNGASQSKRLAVLTELIAESGDNVAGDINPEELLSFAKQILATHEVYRYLNDKIAKRFKENLVNGDNFRISQGLERPFWHARIFGAENRPGIFQIKGTLSRLMKPIHDFALKTYGDQADEYLDAWWATLNILTVNQDQRQTLSKGFKPIPALLRGDLGEASYLIKEQLFQRPEFLPYRSRAKFELDESELSYFTELALLKQVKLRK